VVSPRTLNFRAAPDATATASITIRNTGTGALHVNVGAPKHDPPFSILSNGGALTIPADSSVIVVVQYAPSANGSTDDSISITSDDPKQKKPIEVKLKGKSKAPKR
jgi:HYDIN/CFA65/VesB family protein